MSHFLKQLLGDQVNESRSSREDRMMTCCHCRVVRIAPEFSPKPSAGLRRRHRDIGRTHRRPVRGEAQEKAVVCRVEGDRLAGAGDENGVIGRLAGTDRTGQGVAADDPFPCLGGLADL